MKKSRIKRIGPISYSWGPKKSFLDVYLTKRADSGYGWNWGSDGYESKPIISLRLLGLQIVHFERYVAGGFQLHLLGFWWVV